ncbi:hypothetical protein EHS25_001883 [Saitozyma podzolica]|uniref:Uncharacterized protein n=1 Tax=Saitozyma podzolica TaxID=1890683 RepID=A0A427YFY0_9TREE|nr:hypothetical protein EHS25_001883 [Saitozyma podzolica]
MDGTHLRPADGDLLASDPYLPEMMSYVEHLVEGPEAEIIARNAALAYLALITAFAEKGLLQIDRAPRVLIEVGNRGFEASQLLSSAASSYGAENNLRSVVDDPDFRLASDLTTQWALKKGLQQGRKFLLLVANPERIFYAASRRRRWVDWIWSALRI